MIETDNVGTFYFGIGTTHSVKHNIYTLVPIFLSYFLYFWYTLIYPNVYVDVGWLEAIPISKILKLVLIGTDNVGTFYFGIGTTHDVKHNIYTLVPIHLLSHKFPRI